MSTKAPHVCSDCGHRAAGWFGRCPECGAWASAVAPAAAPVASRVAAIELATTAVSRWSTGLEDVDLVLGGGLVPGSVVLLAGEPGVGKSTLVLQLLHGLGASGARSVLVTAEESVEQVALRATRVGRDLSTTKAAACSLLPETLELAHGSDVLVVDSIQMLEDPAQNAVAGSVTQVRSCTAALVRHAKRSGAVVILVGHVTKDGSVAGPKALEHVVDVVLSLEGDRRESYRCLRSLKNRYGSTEEAGLFVMGPQGLARLPDPSSLMLADRATNASGSIVFPAQEGSRPVLIEIQALVCPGQPPHGRRVFSGLDAKRATLLLGVLKSRCDIALSDNDVFVAAAGGFAVKEPAADLAVALAVASARAGHVIDPGTIAVGEVGLAGEIRRVAGMERRLAEAARLGFTTAIVPPGTVESRTRIATLPVASLRHALNIASAGSVAALTA